MPALNKTESRLPEVFGEATDASALNYFNAQNAALLGYNYLAGDYCLVSYLPASLYGIADIGSLENTYVVFVNAAVGTELNYDWSVTYRLDNAVDVTFAATAAENAAIFALNALDQGIAEDQLSHLTRVEVTCKVSQGGTVQATLKLSHSLSAAQADIAALYAADSDSKAAKGGNAQTTYIAANLMRGNFPTAPTWYEKNAADPAAAPASTTWGEPASAPQLNHPLAMMYARLLKARGKHWFPDFNQAYHDGLNNGDLELYRRDSDNHVGPCAIAPHFAAMALGKITFQRLGGSIKESTAFTAYKALPENDRIDLYNLARFPKSAFVLCARVLEKLLEAAKTNNYTHFLGSASDKTAWKADTATALKDEKFIKSLIFEYLNGPQEDIGGLEYTLGLLRFNQILKRTHKHVWSGYVTTILDYDYADPATTGRVEEAYMARKRVEFLANGQKKVTFERISTHATAKTTKLGQTEYLVMKTKNLSAKKLICNVMTADALLTGTAGEALSLVRWVVNATDPEKLDETATTDFQLTVGDETEVKDEFGDRYQNYADFAQYAIMPLGLRNTKEATFDAWNAKIAASTTGNPILNLEIRLDNPAPGTLIYYGAEAVTNPPVAAELSHSFDNDKKTPLRIQSLNKTGAPRILRAYFSKKTVAVPAAGTQNVTLTRIQQTPTAGNEGSWILGREVYLVVESENINPEHIKCYLQAGDAVWTGAAGKGKPLQFPPMQANGATAWIQPQYFKLNPIVVNPAAPTTYLYDTAFRPSAVVANPYANTATFVNQAIARIALYPHPGRDAAAARVIFDGWASNINASANQHAGITIRVQCSELDAAGSPYYVYYGDAQFAEEAGCGSSKIFLKTEGDKFTVQNREVYEIYHNDNAFNPLRTNAPRGGQACIGRILNSFASIPATNPVAVRGSTGPRTKVNYYYHSEFDNELLVVATSKFRIIRKNIGIIQNTGFRAEAAILTLAFVGSSATESRTYADGTVITSGTYDGRPFIEYGATTNGIANGDVDIVPMEGFDFTFNAVSQPDTPVETIMRFTAASARRGFTKPENFAAFMGALATIEIQITCNGSGCEDGSSYPSTNHVNGEAVDTGYLTNFANEQSFINAMRAYGFDTQLQGCILAWTGTGTAPTPFPFAANFANATPDCGGRRIHNHHLHSEDFNSAFCETIV